MAGAGVHQAGGELEFEGVVQTGLVTADAGVDLIGAVFCGLIDEFRVGEEGARQGDHVRVAGRQHVFTHLGHVDAVAGDHRHAEVLFHLGGDFAERRARHTGSNGGDAGFVPADTGIDDGGAGLFDGLAQSHYFVKVAAAFNQVEHGQAIDDDEVFAYRLANAAHDLDGQAGAIFKAAAPAVFALVGASNDELVDEIAFGAHHFHAVVAGFAGEGGAAHIVVDLLLYFVVAQLLRGEGVDWGLDRRGGDEIRVIGVAPGVQDLHADFAAFLVYGIGDFPVVLGFFGRGHFRRALEDAAFFIGGDAAGHDQANSAAGALCIEGGEAGKAAGVFFQVGVHGAHEDAVFQGGEAQVQGGEQVRIGL